MELVFKLSVVLPVPGAAKLAGEKFAVIPDGIPEALKVMAELKEELPVVARVNVDGLAGEAASDEGAPAKVKVGAGAMVTASATVWELVPLFAVTVME